MEQKNLSIPTAILVGAIIIALAIIIVRTPANPKKVTGPTPGDLVELVLSTGGQTSIPLVTTSDHKKGAEAPLLTIVEYSDLECPFCQRFHNTLNEVVATYGDRIAWVYRHYPIDSLHPKARTEALATECAAEQGKFWEYTDTIFAVTPSNNGLPERMLASIAEDIGLDTNAFTTCMSEERYADKVQTHVEEAQTAGAGGTPWSVFIDQDGTTYTMEGAFPKEAVIAIIEELLNN